MATSICNLTIRVQMDPADLLKLRGDLASTLRPLIPLVDAIAAQSWRRDLRQLESDMEDNAFELIVGD